MENNIKDLLSEINSILKEDDIKKKESLGRGERFNIFSTLGVAHYEVTHSAIIACFLNPKESHGQGDKFLRLFLDTIGDSIINNTSQATVYTEYSTTDGRIDILIEEDNQTHGIIIENKIYAGDQPEQLNRYGKFAQSKYHNDNYSIYYLTLTGTDASEDSAKDISYKCISYSKDILDWLEKCIKESAVNPLIRETLIQYRNHIKQLTNQDMETINKENLLKVMADNSDAVAAICNAQEEYKKYIYEQFVRPNLEEFAKEEKLIFEETNMFKEGRDGRGFYFRREEWHTAAIYIWTDRRGEYDFYWGISNYTPNGIEKFEHQKLDCFDIQPNDYWPYGHSWLDQFRDWTSAENLSKMKEDGGEYLKKLVRSALEEIDRTRIPMP